MFSLAGAHRSGKTTTARMIAERMGIEFLETKVGDVFADLGLDPKADLPFRQRLEVQNEILRTLDAQYAVRVGKPFVADRSPFDVMAYTIADVQRQTVMPEDRTALAAHLQYAEMILDRHLRGVMLLYPLPDQVDAPGKAPACPFYMEHVYFLVRGFAETTTPNLKNGLITAVSQSYDLETRVADGHSFFNQVQGIFAPETKLWTPNS